MFAAAATVAQMAFDLSVQIAKWFATKVLLISLLAIFFPFVMKGLFIWGFKYLITYSRVISEFVMDSVFIATQGTYEVNIELSGVGGYLAIQTGLIDYCAIIFTGWGLYWVIAVLAKTSRVL
jgi:hypothetical protein